uniref:C3H1-type domain-containing protein n=1 Tax=Parastrongyloides trichosuri TaxID=131310 RepID=A0A0N4Z0Z9_PARTI
MDGNEEDKNRKNDNLLWHSYPKSTQLSSNLNSFFITPAIGRPIKPNINTNIPNLSNNKGIPKSIVTGAKKNSLNESELSTNISRHPNNKYTYNIMTSPPSLRYTTSDRTVKENEKLISKIPSSNIPISGSSSLPRKGILKRPASGFMDKNNDTNNDKIISVKSDTTDNYCMTRSLPGTLIDGNDNLLQEKGIRFNEHSIQGNTPSNDKNKGGKPKLSWSEKDAIAIFGDTSDDYTTETENDINHENKKFKDHDQSIFWDLKKRPLTIPKKSTFAPSTNIIDSTISETAILSSEESAQEDDVKKPLESKKFKQDNIDDSFDNSDDGTLHSTTSTIQENGKDKKNNDNEKKDSFSNVSITTKIPNFSLKSSIPPLPKGEERNNCLLKSNSGSQIPSLVNKAFQSGGSRKTPDIDDEIDKISVASSTGSSVIAGKWWFGKDTRYQLHCEKKGCAHKNCIQKGDDDYLTPTQRFTQEIIKLKSDLKKCQSQCKDKDKQLEQLRSKYKDIECLISNSDKFGNQKEVLDRRENEMNEMFRREKNEILEKHEIRVRQLIQETVDARTEMLKCAKKLEDLRSIKENMVDASINTDNIEYFDGNLRLNTNQGVMINSRRMSPSFPPVDPIVQNSEKHSMEAGVGCNLMSPSVGGYGNQTIPEGFNIQDTLNQLAAYQNEGFIWRTKASQLEICLKEQLIKTSNNEAAFMNKIELMQMENDQLKDRIKKLENGEISDDVFETTNQLIVSSSNGIPSNQLTVDVSPISTSAHLSPMPGCDGMLIGNRLSPAHELTPTQLGVISAAAMILGTDCKAKECMEYRRKITEENKELKDKVSSQGNQITDISNDLDLSKRNIEKLNGDIDNLKNKNKQLSGCIEEKEAEVNASSMTISRLHSTNESLNKAVTYLEEKIQVYQDTILKHDLLINDNFDNTYKNKDDPSTWRIGFVDTNRYSVNYSKRVQTDLTAEDLSHHENQFMSLNDKLQELEKEFESKNISMTDRFQDIEQNLILKAKLVETLSRQLEENAKIIQEEEKNRQTEREIFENRINSLAVMANKVPILEIEVEKLREEKSLIELKYKRLEEDYDDILSKNLETNLNKLTQVDVYWKEKMHGLENKKKVVESDLAKIKKDYDNFVLKSKVEKADLEARLTSSITHTNELFKCINKNTIESGVQVEPKMNSKYVSCKPNMKHKPTEIGKDDLWNEDEERLKSISAELQITKKQVKVLQEKLIEFEKHKQESDELSSIGIQISNSKNLSSNKKSYRTSISPKPIDGRSEPHMQIPTIRCHSPSFSGSIGSDIVMGTSITPCASFSIFNEQICENDERLEELMGTNQELKQRIEELESENNEYASREKERIQRLASEFETLRSELDEEIKKYEKEKKIMKGKIIFLEKFKCENMELRRKCKELRKILKQFSKGDEASLDSLCTLEPTSTFLEIDKVIHKSKSSNDIPKNETTNKGIERHVSTSNVNDLSNSNDSYLIEMQKLQSKNMILEKELSLMKKMLENNIKKTLASLTRKIPQKANEENDDEYNNKLTEYSEPEYNNLSNDLDEVCFELTKFMEHIMDSDGSGKLGEHPKKIHKATEKISKWFNEHINNVKNEVCQDKQYNSGIIESLASQLDYVTKNLHDAYLELSLFKQENKNDRKISAGEREKHGFQRSRSHSGRGYGSDSKNKYDSLSLASKELKEWKEKTGTMFRELYRLRGEFSKVDEERRELIYNLKILRGELEIEKAKRETLEVEMKKKLPPKKDVMDTSNIIDEKISSMKSFDRGTVIKSMNSLYHSINSEQSIGGETGTFKSLSTISSNKRKAISDNSMLTSFVSCYSLNDLESEQGSLNEESTATLLNEIRNNKAITIKQLSLGEPNLIINNKKVSPEKLLNKNKIHKRTFSQTDDINIVTSKRNMETELIILREALKKQSIKLKDKIKYLEEELERCKISENERKSIKNKIEMQRVENEMYERRVRELEEERQNMYLIMFKKGQEAQRFEGFENKTIDQMTEDRIILKFLHDALYYYFVNKGDSKEHLQAILTMLNFTPQQKDEVLNHYSKRKSPF